MAAAALAMCWWPLGTARSNFAATRAHLSVDHFGIRLV